MAQCTEDMCYLNQPLEAIRGKENVRKMIASIFKPAKRVEFKLVHVFGHENKVITERVDQWDWNGSGTWQMALKVCGMFELTENGKIIEWREYYDNEYWTKCGGPTLVFDEL
jgi:limonene-1,2-epoxide hydrolase